MPLIEDREALFLAMLLHDTGKGGVGGQEKAGARAARSACERMGLERERIELVAWLVEHHLMMSDFAQKRDVADPRTVAAFAAIVENPERLRLLLVLTVADIRAVGRGSGTAGRASCCASSIGATEAVFRGGRGGDPAASYARHLKAAAAAARARPGRRRPRRGRLGRRDGGRLFRRLHPEEQLAHAALARRRQGRRRGGRTAEVRADRNAAEVMVTAGDRRGLFADLAEVLAGFGANVVGARAYTSRRRTGAGRLLSAGPCRRTPSAPKAQRAGRAGAGAGGRRAGRGCKPCRAATAGGSGPRGGLHHRPDGDGGQRGLGRGQRDRGLRPRPAGPAGRAWPRALAEAGLSIQSAHIDNYGERAVDAFYCHESPAGKLTDPRRIAALKAVLTEVLDDVGGVSQGRPRLQRARASVAR